MSSAEHATRAASAGFAVFSLQFPDERLMDELFGHDSRLLWFKRMPCRTRHTRPISIRHRSNVQNETFVRNVNETPKTTNNDMGTVC